jgi:hypothetical protein
MPSEAFDDLPSPTLLGTMMKFFAASSGWPGPNNSPPKPTVSLAAEPPDPCSTSTGCGAWRTGYFTVTRSPNNVKFAFGPCITSVQCVKSIELVQLLPPPCRISVRICRAATPGWNTPLAAAGAESFHSL